MRGSREISLVPSLHRASTDALMMSLSTNNAKVLEDNKNFSHSSSSKQLLCGELLYTYNYTVSN